MGCGGIFGPRQSYTEESMCSAEQRKLAIETYIKFDLSAAGTIAEHAKEYLDQLDLQ